MLIGDLVKWFVMPSLSEGFKHQTNGGNIIPYGRDTHHLEGLKLNGSKAEPSYHAVTPNNLIFMKGRNGNPWDVKSYNNSGIFDLITELGGGSTPQQQEHNWNDPTAYKVFTPPVRMWDRDAGHLPERGYGSMDSPFTSNQGGKQLSKSTVGQTYYALAGPYPIDHGGDIATKPTLVLSYFWDGGAVREELYLTKEFGWCRWSTAHADHNNGEYVIDDATIHNMLVIGGAPKPNFPAFQL